jgi:uncharacterized protein (TIGR02453 family)
MPKFRGFPTGTLRFLRELEQHNDRAWFAEHKDRYEELVREPALDFIATMSPQLFGISEHFVALPKKVGGSLMRVYRDVRFSKDKTPYKTNIGIQFRHELAADVHAPGYYLHIDNGGCFLAAGVWRPESSALAKIRKRISEQPAQWRKAHAGRAFKSCYTLGGDSLQRPPRGFAVDDPAIEDLKRKDFIALADFPARAARSADFVKTVACTYRKATPFMVFLCAALEVEF